MPKRDRIPKLTTQLRFRWPRPAATIPPSIHQELLEALADLLLNLASQSPEITDLWRDDEPEDHR